jgi:hypothetical protein
MLKLYVLIPLFKQYGILDVLPKVKEYVKFFEFLDNLDKLHKYELKIFDFDDKLIDNMKKCDNNMKLYSQIKESDNESIININVPIYYGNLKEYARTKKKYQSLKQKYFKKISDLRRIIHNSK